MNQRSRRVSLFASRGLEQIDLGRFCKGEGGKCEGEGEGHNWFLDVK